MELTIDQALQKAVEAHKVGQIQEADRLYTAILKAQPKHPDANHNLGVLAVSIGKVNEALPFLKAALEANPNIAQFWISYVDALVKLDRNVDAKALLEQAKSKGVTGDSFDKLDQRLQNAGQVHLEAEKVSDEPQPKQPNILDSLKINQAIKLAKKSKSDGALEEAKRIYQDILLKFPKNKRAKEGLKGLDRGANVSTSKIQDPPKDRTQSLINLYSQGQLKQALEQADILLKQFPNSATLFNIQGAILKGLGQLELSVDAFNKALSHKPDFAHAFYNLGASLQDQQRLEEALNAYTKALAIKPDYAAAYNNIGNAFKDQGKLQDALEAYNKAVAINPNFAEAYNNMGVTLSDQGKLQAALEAYEKALSIKPEFADACYNIGVTLQAVGELEKAIGAYYKAIVLKPDYTNAYYNMGTVLKGLTFNQPNFSLQKIISLILDKKSFARPKNVATAGISLLKLEPKLKRHLQTSTVAELKPKLPEVITDLHELPLLSQLMSVCPIPDLEVENLLTKLRESLLYSIFELTNSTEQLKFQSALALQCFTNEYIYDQSAHEDEAIAALERIVERELSEGVQPNPKHILCLASYKSLDQYDWSSLLRTNYEIQNVFERQVTETNKEAELKTVIPVLENITNKISSKVRDQYEASPYPRWINLGLRPKPAPLSEVIAERSLRLFDDKVKEIESPEILVAGCGTGQHSIGSARKYENCKVLAVDLSLSSLSYAKRKTNELGIQNIDYLQADILELEKLGQKFDVVESAGVLHHMEEPMAGWKVLTDCLRSGGLMKIGLYSELAREHIVRIRQEILSAGIGSSNAEIKRFRQKVITSKQNHHKRIHESTDFYSLSELKDLLFHVQEHRFTLPQIQDCLSELGLQFCGFEGDTVVSHFKQIYTNPQDLYDLNKWHAFEEANPNMFASMYQFWCQKIY